MTDKYFRGTNVQDRWEQKHKNEYKIDKPYDFSVYESGDMSGYSTVAAKFLENEHENFNRKSFHEIGCAGGDFVAYLKTHVLPDWYISAEDFSEPAIAAAKRRCPTVDFHVNDFLLNRLDRDYGCIGMFETIEHIEEGTNYEILDNILEHCEYALISTVTTRDDCFGEHISHYTQTSFKDHGYEEIWSHRLGTIDMSATGDYGDYFYFISILEGKL